MTAGPIAKLVAAYPDFLASHDADTLTWKDGTVMILDDGKGEKDPETRLNEPDLKDMFYASYPQGRSGIPPQLDCDPGRVRYQLFFDKKFKAVSAELSLREKPFEMKWTRWLPGLVTLREYRGGDQPGSHDQTKDHGAHS